MPKADVRDPGQDALENHDRKMTEKAQEELRAYNMRAREIQGKNGPEASAKFEEEYNASND